MVANKNDLIWLKRTRDSKQDQADIEKLEDDKSGRRMPRAPQRHVDLVLKTKITGYIEN